jgi:hypothetical protein
LIEPEREKEKEEARLLRKLDAKLGAVLTVAAKRWNHEASLTTAVVRVAAVVGSSEGGDLCLGWIERRCA